MRIDLRTKYMGRSETARALGISAEGVTYLTRRGYLPATQSPGGMLYRRVDVARLALERAARPVRRPARTPFDG